MRRRGSVMRAPEGGSGKKLITQEPAKASGTYPTAKACGLARLKTCRSSRCCLAVAHTSAAVKSRLTPLKRAKPIYPTAEARGVYGPSSNHRGHRSGAGVWETRTHRQ